MTASTASSTIVTNTLASPVTYNSIAGAGTGKTKIYAGTMAIATTSIDEAADKIMLFPIRGSSRLVSLRLFCDDLDSNATPTLAADVGLYKDVDAAGTTATTVDVDAYASASIVLQAAVTTGTEVAFEARNITAMGQTVAADGAESEHNEIRYVGLNVTTAAATAAAGDISWIAEVIEP
jgi:hypothetical protein